MEQGKRAFREEDGGRGQKRDPQNCETLQRRRNSRANPVLIGKHA